MVGNLNNPHEKYLKTRIETASQPQLLLMLFDAAVKKLNIAKKAIQDSDIEKSHTELTKVQKIFTELMVALDYEKGGDLASELLRIYDFIYHHLVKANIKQDIQMIDEVLPVVENLRDGWTQAVEKFQEEQGDMQETKMAVGSENDRSPTPATKPASQPLAKVAKFQTVTPTQVASQDDQRPRLNIRG